MTREFKDISEEVILRSLAAPGSVGSLHSSADQVECGCGVPNCRTVRGSSVESPAARADRAARLTQEIEADRILDALTSP